MSLEFIIKNLSYNQTKKLLQGEFIITEGGEYILFAKAEIIDNIQVGWLFAVRPQMLSEYNNPVAIYNKHTNSWNLI